MFYAARHPQRGGDEGERRGNGHALAGKGGVAVVFFGQDGGGAAHGHSGQDHRDDGDKIIHTRHTAGQQYQQRNDAQPDEAVEDGVAVQWVPEVDVAAADDGANQNHGHAGVADADALDGVAQECGQRALGEQKHHAQHNGHDAGMPDGLEDNGFPVSTLFFRSGGGSPGTLHKVAHAH